MREARVLEVWGYVTVSEVPSNWAPSRRFERSASLSRHAQFRRFKVDRGAETCVVDLVVDTVGQIETKKRQIGTVCVDTLREMFANRLTMLVSRSEIRDLVDVQKLLEHGPSLEQGLRDALTKDGSADAATARVSAGE